jgi:hypothetical protein
MDPIIEYYVDQHLIHVKRFISSSNTLYLTGYHKGMLYEISKSKFYIFTVDNKYVLVTISPIDLVEVLDKMLKNQPYQVDDFTRLIASMSNNTTFN